ncbi:MAG: toll/interleukin-1 receptor domain-containing protein [Chloroflexota bacterium]
MNSATKEHSIFLSYAHQDASWVAEFADALRTAGIHNYWFEDKTILPADRWVEKTENALRQSDTFIAFFSANSLKNSNVFFEVGAAFADNKTIIPVLIGNIDQQQIPLSLAARQWVSADSPKEAGKQVARIIEEKSHSSSKS